MNNSSFDARATVISVQANMLRLFGIRRASVEDFRCAVFLATRDGVKVSESALKQYELFAQFIEQKNLLLSEIDICDTDYSNQVIFVRKVASPLENLFNEAEGEKRTQIRATQISHLHQIKLYRCTTTINRIKEVYSFFKDINKYPSLGLSKYIVENFNKFLEQFHKNPQASLSSISMFYGKAPGAWKIMFFDSAN